VSAAQELLEEHARKQAPGANRSVQAQQHIGEGSSTITKVVPVSGTWESSTGAMETIRSSLAGNSAPMGFGWVKVEGTELEIEGDVEFVVQGSVAFEIVRNIQHVKPARDFEGLRKKEISGGVVRASGQIEGFKRLLEKWGFSRKEGATILGFDDEVILWELFQGIRKPEQRDVRDRLDLFLRIAGDLYGLFRSHDVIRDWLNESKDIVGGKAPRELLVEGSMENLIRVKHLAQQEANR
jgi:hypothetical protein